MFTWSLGCSSTPFCLAREAMTSLVFMLEEVPEPVWKTSIGNSASYLPVAISLPAAMMASAISPSNAPESLLTCAHAAFRRPIARICADSKPRPEIGKFSTARWVCARHSASLGTCTSPIVSCSMRYSVMKSTFFVERINLFNWNAPSRHVSRYWVLRLCAFKWLIFGSRALTLGAGLAY